MSITKEQAATWFETIHLPGPAAREMYRMAAEALRNSEGRIPGRCAVLMTEKIEQLNYG